jgi:hypothetical protein
VWRSAGSLDRYKVAPKIPLVIETAPNPRSLVGIAQLRKANVLSFLRMNGSMFVFVNRYAGAKIGILPFWQRLCDFAT